jgi:hypothetical protein
MKDSEHIIYKYQLGTLIKNNVMYIEVETEDRDSTYRIKYTGRSNSTAISLNENIYEFIPLSDQKVVYFNFQHWLEEMDNEMLNFTVNIVKVIGEV